MDLANKANRIKELNREVISKIAAGEVIQRPSSALKELIENSLDAGSTTITIKLRDGGMTLLQISDNGSGIHMDDFPILCHRFTTSKISTYEDLGNLFTFGFRGEALSSISQVSRLTVCSRKQGEPIGYKAEYSGGDLLCAPQPYAYEKGTAIVVAEMFGNNSNRKRSLMDFSELHKKCAEVTMRYALQYPGVAFKFIKGECIDFSTNGKNDRADALKVILRNCKIEHEIMEIPEADYTHCRFFGLISTSMYSLKQKLFILFVNGRLVESNDLRKLLNEIYATHMPKSSTNFIYISITVPPNEIDVNVHPTKQEIRFSKQLQIFSEITSRVQDILSLSNASRTLTVKSFEIPKTPLVKPSVSSKVRSQASVPLEWYLEPKPSLPQKQAEENLESITSLLEEISTGKEQEIFDAFNFIGTVSKDIALVQHNTSVYMLLCQSVFECLIYQYILDNFARFASFNISNSDLAIDSLLELAFSSQGYNPASDPPIEDLINNYTGLLNTYSGMLEEYFSIGITSNTIVSLPVLIDGLVKPDSNNLPEFVLRLCTDIDWRNEKPCLEGISRLLAWFYSRPPDKWAIHSDENSYDYHYKNSLFPYLRGRIKADTRRLCEGNGVMHVVSTESLYKIFERC